MLIGVMLTLSIELILEGFLQFYHTFQHSMENNMRCTTKLVSLKHIDFSFIFFQRAQETKIEIDLNPRPKTKASKHYRILGSSYQSPQLSITSKKMSYNIEVKGS